QRHERGVLDDPWRVAAQRCRGEEGVHVQIALPGTSIDEPTSAACRGVEYELETVRQQMLTEHIVDIRCGDRRARCGAASIPIARNGHRSLRRCTHEPTSRDVDIAPYRDADSISFRL